MVRAYTQRYKVRIKGKWSNPEKGVAPFSTLRCSSYLKEILDCGHQLFLYKSLNSMDTESAGFGKSLFLVYAIIRPINLSLMLV